jgi:hypothetical protein
MPPLTCPGCSVSVPTLSASCGKNKKTGGIPYLAIVACDDTTIAAAPTTLSVWTAAVAANDARVIKGLLGELQDPSNTTKRIGSCDPETLLGRAWTLNFEDYDFTETGSPLTFEKEVFYNTIQTDPSKYNLYFGTCDGRMWQVPNFTLMMNVIIPNTNTDARYMKVTVMFQGLTMGNQYIFDLGTV